MKESTDRFGGGGHFDGGLCVTLLFHCHPLTSDGPIESGTQAKGPPLAHTFHIYALCGERERERVRLPLTLSTIFCEALFSLLVVPQASILYSLPMFRLNLPVQ